MNIFLDSDIIISSYLSKSGAAYTIIHSTSIGLATSKYISNMSYTELEIVFKRDRLNFAYIQSLREHVHTVTLKQSGKDIVKRYSEYVFDVYDSHVVAGAVESQSRFLITYNIKDFNYEKIKQDLNILVISPGTFLQYLRSKE